MAIICDICDKPILAPKIDLDEDEPAYEVIKLNGEKICFCTDCAEAISEYLTTKECKEMCKKYAEKADLEL